MSIINAPSFVYPLGNEVISSFSINISWTYPGLSKSEPKDNYWFDLYFTDDYDNQNTNWVQIASLPSNIRNYSWSFPHVLKSSKCRFGIRSRNFSGYLSEMQITPANFAIQKRRIESPQVISPVEGESFKDELVIILDFDAVKNSISQRSTYEVYYNNEDLNIDWTLMKSGISIDTSYLSFDVSGWQSSDNYGFRIILTDDEGNYAEPVFIFKVSIFSSFLFLLDSRPPTIDFNILPGSSFVNRSNILLDISAFDALSEVKTVEAVEIKDGEKVEETRKKFNYSKYLPWTLTEGDGVKTIALSAKDYADNDSEDNDNAFLGIYYSNLNKKIQTYSFDGLPLFVFEDGVVVRGKNVLGGIDGEATFIFPYIDTYFISSNNDEGQTVIYIYRNGSFSEFYSFDNIENKIVSMEFYKSKLFMAFNNGLIYTLDLAFYTGGGFFDIVNLDLLVAKNKNISYLSSDSHFLYLFFDNKSVEVYDGSNFYTIET